MSFFKEIIIHYVFMYISIQYINSACITYKYIIFALAN